jgi:hypothetical protein
VRQAINQVRVDHTEPLIFRINLKINNADTKKSHPVNDLQTRRHIQEEQSAKIQENSTADRSELRSPFENNFVKTFIPFTAAIANMDHRGRNTHGF